MLSNAFQSAPHCWVAFWRGGSGPLQGRMYWFLPSWRRTATLLGLILVTVSIVCGGFAWAYWNRFPSSGLPRPTYVARYLGFYAAFATIPISWCGPQELELL